MGKLRRFFSVKRNRIIIGSIWLGIMLVLGISLIITEQMDYQVQYSPYAECTKLMLFSMVVIPGGIFGLMLVGLIIAVVVKKLVKLIKWIFS